MDDFGCYFVPTYPHQRTSLYAAKGLTPPVVRPRSQAAPRALPATSSSTAAPYLHEEHQHASNQQEEHVVIRPFFFSWSDGVVYVDNTLPVIRRESLHGYMRLYARLCARTASALGSDPGAPANSAWQRPALQGSVHPEKKRPSRVCVCLYARGLYTSRWCDGPS